MFFIIIYRIIENTTPNEITINKPKTIKTTAIIVCAIFVTFFAVLIIGVIIKWRRSRIHIDGNFNYICYLKYLSMAIKPKLTRNN